MLVLWQRLPAARERGSWAYRHTIRFIILFIYLLLAVLGLHCCEGFSLVVVSGDYSLVSVHELLIAVASPVVEYRL